MPRELKQLNFLRKSIAECSPDQCLIWPFSTKSQMGYGQVPIGNGKAGSAHVVAWKETHPGEQIPPGKDVMHSSQCSSPKCFNPFHLSLGSRKENMQMAKYLGRLHGPGDKVAGEKNGRAVLKSSTILEIRARSEEGIGYRKIAAEFGVARTTVQKIVRRELWAHIK